MVFPRRTHIPFPLARVPLAAVPPAWVLPAMVLCWASLAVAPAALPALEPGVFEMGSLNRRYDELAPEMVPWREGAVAVELSSPRQELSLFYNRIVLRPQADGSFGLTLVLEFGGSADLVADLDLSGARSRLTDHIVVPRQRRTVMSRVKLLQGKDGYLVTVLELPKSFEVEIESQLGSRLVSACRPLAVLLAMDCTVLEQIFTRVTVPMPPPGETYYFEYARLSPGERAAIDRYLALASPPAAR